jgi:hypothetical protein
MKLPRVRLTVLTLMVVVVVAALLMSWFRPLTPADAVRLAEARFQKIPGAVRWAGRYRVHAWPAGSKNRGEGWFVDFKASEDGSHLSQMWVSSKGTIHGIGLASEKFR